VRPIVVSATEKGAPAVFSKEAERPILKIKGPSEKPTLLESTYVKVRVFSLLPGEDLELGRKEEKF